MRVAAGLVILWGAIATAQWVLMALGVMFLLLSLFSNSTCFMTGSCSVPEPLKKDQTTDIHYEELDTK
ncbi:MAG: hypothetical protein JNL59_06725 [Chitinophagaceae bacterium]|jgi:hypothetical protein|nr:hypothetical protein [Chitinophagaceae bacterium]